jgi:erythromycin esterase
MPSIKQQHIACMKTILLAVIVWIIPYSGIAQVFSNLDFEYGVYKAQPRKWSIEGEGKNYAAHLDSTRSKSGIKSLYATLRDAQVFVFLSIPGKLVAGKQIHIEGYLKSTSSDSLVTMLMLHDPTGGRPIASPPSPKNDDWTLISHHASFPQNFSSDRLLVALMAEGTGEFWFDNVRITIDGQNYGNGEADFREPTKKEIEALSETIIPIGSLAPDSENNDLIPIKKIVAKANIVALGENSHGSASIYKLKLRLIQYLVENEGFSIFALESPTVEADRINDYVLSGKGTKAQVLKDLVYPSWQTQEMVDIIEWMKSHNKNSPNKIQFRGFDMQNGSSALEAVADFAERHDSKLTMEVVELKNLYSDSSKDDQKWKLIVQRAEEVNKQLNLQSYSNIDPGYVDRIRHYMDIVVQGIPPAFKSEKSRSRDEYMAHNVNWILKHSGDKKLILSADNTHVTKASGKMGYFLKEMYGDKYLPFGFTYSKGTYSAYGPEKYYEVHPPFAGTYEYFLSKASYKNFFLDLKSANEIDLINKPAGFRSIGSRPQETTQFTEINLKNHFDVVVYIENSVHTESIIK